ncbi:MAG: hypothetical protein V3R89_01590, partial [Thermoanaerobaculia bacterium]
MRGPDSNPRPQAEGIADFTELTTPRQLHGLDGIGSSHSGQKQIQSILDVVGRDGGGEAVGDVNSQLHLLPYGTGAQQAKLTISSSEDEPPSEQPCARPQQQRGEEDQA